MTPPSPPADDADTPRELTADELDRWVLFGGTWRTVQVDEHRGVVDLCTCAGEAVDRRQSTDSEVMARLRDGRRLRTAD
jgi:hypothetical protein